MIITITPNPAVDKSTSTEQLIPEKKLRCTQMVVEAGGGGINVSKALTKLGAPNTAIITSGGFNGSQLEACLEKDSIHFLRVPIQGETRENMVVLESNSNNQFRFVLPGPSLGATDADQILNTLSTLAQKPALIVGSGSLPPGFPTDFYARIASFASANGIPCLIDCSGEPLLKAAEAGVFLLKPNLNELSQLTGKDKLETSEVKEAARQLLHTGRCKMVVVSLGAQGALLVTQNSHLQVAAPTVKKQSTVGAGDSMVAGMAYQIWKGASPEDMVRFGVACGTAATMNPGTQLFDPADVNRLFHWLNQHP